MISLAELLGRARRPRRPAGAVDPPKGYLDWIAREQADGRDLAMTHVVPAALPDTTETIALLRSIKARVESGARYWPDKPGADTWGPLEICQDPASFNYGKRIGDCENFACSYLLEGLAEGLPRGSLRLAAGPNLRGGHHAVLAVVLAGQSVPLLLDHALSGLWPRDRHPLASVMPWIWERPGWAEWWTWMP